VGTGFPKRSCSNKKIERDDDSRKSHPALARSIRLWELPKAEAADPAPARRGSEPVLDLTATFVAAAHNGLSRIISLRPIPICIASRLERDHSLHKVGIGPVGA
jgi:hypothetical protein